MTRRCVWSRNLEHEEAKARYRAVKIQPQWVVTSRKQTNKQVVFDCNSTYICYLNTVGFAHVLQETFVRINDNTCRNIGICLTRRCCAVQQTNLTTTDVNCSCNRSDMGGSLDRPITIRISLPKLK